ncbi:MAG: alpha-ribazole phosphatase [Sphingobacteriales bacterium]
MALIFLRHPEPDCPPNWCYGQTDLLPKKWDIKELDSLIKELALWSEYTIWSSPLLRCTQLADSFKYPYQTDDRLMEMSFGNWENQSWDSLPRDATNAWADNWKTKAVPGGESWEDLVFRVSSFMDQINPAQNHLIIAHLGVIRAAKCILEEVDVDEVFRWKLGFLGHYITP